MALDIFSNMFLLILYTYSSRTNMQGSPNTKTDVCFRKVFVSVIIIKLKLLKQYSKCIWIYDHTLDILSAVIFQLMPPFVS